MRTNYIEILNNKVEIPIIQRDYAQGRTDSKTNKIRKDFLDVLFDFIHYKHSKNLNAEIELDFIYGFNEHESDQITFVPIDGQQRLTTLWLLYWFISTKENVPNDEKLFLSNFLYETRHSTTEFCKKLVQFKPNFSSNYISNEITNQAWYFETWDFDPSIQAILIVLDDIQERYEILNNSSVWKVIEGSNCPFYFYKLDMNKVGLTDDLYIKMNSRGKALTEFEYFKASFLEILTNAEQKEKFEKSIDSEWIDVVWSIVLESGYIKDEEDIASLVDDAFLNLFNFITSIISLKKEILTSSGSRYLDTVDSAELLKIIYSDIENQNFLFDTLDAICIQHDKEPLFWNKIFYFDKTDFNSVNTRLFFQHKEVNLLKRCLFHFSESRGMSFPEQLLLLACLTQLKKQAKEFKNRIRIVRNLVINSENELRETILGNSFDEIEKFITNGDLNVLKNFKTDQIDEEKKKTQFLILSVIDIEILKQLEDSDILRGSISLFPLESNFGNRAEKFLKLFEEDEIVADFNIKSNLLLCFGDYSQDEVSMTNLMSSNKTYIRSFLTTPGYNKTQFYTKTQKIVLACLDYFIVNPTISSAEKIEETLADYSNNIKDWRYYFIKYSSFREYCTRGYYCWSDSEYCLLKMRVKQFNGYHWDPFLLDLTFYPASKNLSLDNYGAKTLFTLNRKKILISSLSNGFLFENGMSTGVTNSLLNDLKNNNTITEDGELIIPQNKDGFDLEDRLEIIRLVLQNLIDK